MGFLFRHHYTTKNKHFPTPTQVRERIGRHLIKVEITYQKKTLQEEIPQKEMVTPIDEALTQNKYKAIEELAETLKKMGGHLSKLEESKIKKLVHVEIHDEQEKEEWDEKDKTDFERNKHFEKLTVDTMAMKDKMQNMQLAFHKAQRMDDCLYNMGRLSSKVPIPLPPKFKISDAEKLNRIGDPKKHVRRYKSIAEIKGLDEKKTLHAFPLSLTRGALRWYYSLDPSKTKVRTNSVELFVDQFIFNTMVDVTLRNLETTKQGAGETFFEYMTK